MALVEGCKHSLEISVPADEVETETTRVVADLQKRARLPGFRPGKAPASLLRKQFGDEIQRQVMESLIPKHLQKQIEAEDLHLVGRPDITDVHFHAGEPFRFTAEFEVMPSIELGDYKDITVPYHDPEITAEDIDKRIEELREQKAEFINIDPRPLEKGDHAVVALESVAGLEGEPIKRDEMTLEIGGADTLPEFSANLEGASPGEEREFDVSYPDDYGQSRFAGKTIRFRAQVKTLRRKELPELNDEFAKDLGDFRDLEELRESLRKSLFAQRQYEAQQEAKSKIVDTLVDAHDFAVPRAFIERQVQNRLEQDLRTLVAGGVDPESLKPDWQKVMDAHQDRALREVKASLLLTRIAERESIAATRDEVDREVERIAKQQREPFAAARLRLEKDGTLGRIAQHIETEKTLSFLFEHARKTTE